MKDKALFKYKLDLQGKTQKELADMLEITYDSLYKKTTGYSPFMYEEVLKIKKYLKLSDKEVKSIFG